MEEVKSLLNCDTYDFFKAFNAMRNDFDEFFKATKINDIVYKKYDIPEDAPSEEREKIFTEIGNDRFNKVVQACFGDNIDLTYNLLTKICFGDEEYIKKMSEIEIVGFVFKVFMNSRLLPFFAIYKPSE